MTQFFLLQGGKAKTGHFNTLISNHTTARSGEPHKASDKGESIVEPHNKVLKEMRKIY